MGRGAPRNQGVRVGSGSWDSLRCVARPRHLPSCEVKRRRDPAEGHPLDPPLSMGSSPSGTRLLLVFPARVARCPAQDTCTCPQPSLDMLCGWRLGPEAVPEACRPPGPLPHPSPTVDPCAPSPGLWPASFPLSSRTPDPAGVSLLRHS